MENLLKRVLDKEGLSHLYTRRGRKRAFQNPFENSSWANLLDGALKGLEIVALATFDWKLTGIVKLLQSWIKDKREEQQRDKQTQEYGANYDLTNPGALTYDDPGFTGYY